MKTPGHVVKDLYTADPSVHRTELFKEYLRTNEKFLNSQLML